MKDCAGNGLAVAHTSLFSTGTSLSPVTVAAESAGPVLIGAQVNFTASAAGPGSLSYSSGWSPRRPRPPS